jgi:Uma2 family endonuclease
MTANAPAVLMDPDDLLRMPEGDHYELVHGRPVEKDMGAKSDEISLAIGSLLRLFVSQHGLGRTYGSSTGYQCFPADPGRVRKPDASFVAKGRLPDDKTPDGHIKLAPDLAIEVVSPNDSAEEVEGKVGEYLSARVRLVWVVFPIAKTVHVRRLSGTCDVLTESGSLSGEDVVPGFTCRVADLFV